MRPTSRFSVSRPAGLKVSALDRRAQSVRVESLRRHSDGRWCDGVGLAS